MSLFLQGPYIRQQLVYTCYYCINIPDHHRIVAHEAGQIEMSQKSEVTRGLGMACRMGLERAASNQVIMRGTTGEILYRRFPSTVCCLVEQKQEQEPLKSMSANEWLSKDRERLTCGGRVEEHNYWEREVIPIRSQVTCCVR